MRCNRCGLVCRYRFSTIEFFYQAEEKSMTVELKGEDLGYCHYCNQPLRDLLYVIWDHLKNKPENSDLPKLWSVGFIRWTSGKVNVVWG